MRVKACFNFQFLMSNVQCLIPDLILVFITPRIIRNAPQPVCASQSSAVAAVKESVIPKIIGEREQDPFVDIKRKEIVSQVLRGYEVKK